MDEEFKKKIEQARQEGYTDEEINAFLATKGMSISGQPVTPTQIGPVAPSPATTGGMSPEEGELLGLGGVGAGLGAAALGGGALALKKFFFDPYLEQKRLDTKTAATKEARLQAGGGGGRTPVSQLGPVEPNKIIDPRTGQPQQIYRQAPASQGSSMLQKGMDVATKMREIAAQRVTMPGGVRAPIGPALLGGLGAATYSGDLGPTTPTTGRMRGMEINPMTGRPWTKQEIQMYERNPQQFDQILGQPMMPR